MQRQLLYAHPSPNLSSSISSPIAQFGSCAASARCSMSNNSPSQLNKLKKDIVRERELCKLMYDLYKKSPASHNQHRPAWLSPVTSTPLPASKSNYRPNNNNNNHHHQHNSNKHYNNNHVNGQTNYNNQANKKRRPTGSDPVYVRPKTVTPTSQTPKTRSPNSNHSSPYYAGAKFSEAPLPSSLPMPPAQWLEKLRSSASSSPVSSDSASPSSSTSSSPTSFDFASVFPSQTDKQTKLSPM